MDFIKHENKCPISEVRPLYHRECEPLICPSYQDLQGLWRSSVPVCASNGYTYGHIHQVRCLKDFMPSIFEDDAVQVDVNFIF